MGAFPLWCWSGLVVVIALLAGSVAGGVLGDRAGLGTTLTALLLLLPTWACGVVVLAAMRYLLSRED